MAVQVLSPSRHRHLRWRRFNSYVHANRNSLVGLAAAEVSKAALALPLTFTNQQGQWSLCALLGFVPGQNLYVTPDGQWIGAYIPATLRAHPFHLGWEGTDANLCIDEDSGLLVSDGSGEPIFSEKGGLSDSVEQVWNFLSQTADSLLALEEACGVLAAAGVIEPWPISVQTAEGSRPLSGLHRINEAALNGMDDATFGNLRRAGVVGVAYAQLLSMGNLADLGKLAPARADAWAYADAAARAQAEQPPMVNLPTDSTIDWDWSKVGR